MPRHAAWQLTVGSWQFGNWQLTVGSCQLPVSKKKFEDIFLLHNLTEIMGQPLFQNSQFERASRKWRQLKLEFCVRHPWRQLKLRIADSLTVSSRLKLGADVTREAVQGVMNTFIEDGSAYEARRNEATRTRHEFAWVLRARGRGSAYA